MNDLTLPASSLTALSKQAEARPALATAISERLRHGQLQEVRDFVASCDVALLRELECHTHSAIWQRDAAAWRTLARATAPRGVLWRGPERDLMQGDASFSHELRAIAEAHVAAAAIPSRKAARYFVLHKVVQHLPYPGIGREEVLELVGWTLALRRTVGIDDNDTEACCGLPELLACLDDTADLVALAGQSEGLCEFALRAHKSRLREGEARRHWLPWRDFFQRHPGYLDTFHALVADPALIVGHWPQASPALRDALRATLASELAYCAGDDRAYFFDAVDWIVRDHEAGFAHFLKEETYYFNVGLASLIWQQQYPLLLPQLLPRMFGRYEHLESYKDTLCAMLAAQPRLMLSVPAASLDRVVACLPAELLRASLPLLGPLIGASASKALRAAIAEAAKQLDLADIVAAGWLGVRNKNLRLACKDLLLAHPDTERATPLLADMLAGGALDAASASALSATLAQRAGQAMPVAPGPGEEALASLEAASAGIKRWSAAIKPLDNPDTLALFQPLSEHAARAALHLAATGAEGMPPLALALLAQLSPENRARLASQALETWIAGDGEPKLRWMLRLAEDGADERIVDLLSAAVFTWGKTRKQRAVIALDQLASLDSLYALARVLDIAESRKLKRMVVDAAMAALHAAAARRQLLIGELLDELTPDFGLGEGLTLAVGTLRYQVALQGDLSLRLVDARGKVSKTLPANKDDSLHAEWDAANSRFKTLGAALKTVAKQVAPRMQVAFVSGKRWSAQRWTRLFRDHPLLNIMGRSLVWQSHGALSASFRIAEDLSLLRADDMPFALQDDAVVTLWHPVSAGAGEREAWRAHVADYELAPLIDQLGAPDALPPAAAMHAERLLAPLRLCVAQEQLASVMHKCGYRQGPSGDGGWIAWHAWPLAAAELEVRLQNGMMSPYMDIGSRVAIDSIEVWNTKGGQTLVAPADLPAPLLATLWAHLQLLDTKRMAPAIDTEQ